MATSRSRTSIGSTDLRERCCGCHGLKFCDCETNSETEDENRGRQLPTPELRLRLRELVQVLRYLVARSHGSSSRRRSRTTDTKDAEMPSDEVEVEDGRNNALLSDSVRTGRAQVLNFQKWSNISRLQRKIQSIHAITLCFSNAVWATFPCESLHSVASSLRGPMMNRTMRVRGDEDEHPNDEMHEERKRPEQR
jgi:hypothetical protein